MKIEKGKLYLTRTGALFMCTEVYENTDKALFLQQSLDNTHNTQLVDLEYINTLIEREATDTDVLVLIDDYCAHESELLKKAEVYTTAINNLENWRETIKNE